MSKSLRKFLCGCLCRFQNALRRPNTIANRLLLCQYSLSLIYLSSNVVSPCSLGPSWRRSLPHSFRIFLYCISWCLSIVCVMVSVIPMISLIPVFRTLSNRVFLHCFYLSNSFNLQAFAP